MSLPGEIANIHRRLDNLQVGGSHNSDSSILTKLIDNEQKIIIEVTNNTGSTVNAYSCMNLISGASAADIATIAKPSSDDDPETSLYGVMIDSVDNGRIGHLQISGSVMVAVDPNSDPMISQGETIYPVDGDIFVTNLAGGNTDILPTSIGKSLDTQADDSDFITILLKPTSGKNNKNLYIISVQADYLTCNTKDDGSGDTCYVAKPTRLRSTDTAARSVAGQTYTVTKSSFTTGVTSGDAQTCTATRSSSGTDTLEVVEPYLAGDEIIALPCGDTGLTDPDGNAITYVDANVDARHWAVKSTA